MKSLVGSDRSGWQFITEGGPWVAQRVCAIETCELNTFAVSTFAPAIRCRRPATLPTSLK